MGFIKNVLTFGASGRIENKAEEFEELRTQLIELNDKMEAKKTVVNLRLEVLIQVKTDSVKSLKMIEKISKNIKGKERDLLVRKVGQEIESIDFNKIENTVSVAELAINSVKGVTSGVATALGAWALVGQVGVASTGAVITSLSGVAATNATLAWFGGGALAAGGGGMAAGTMVLGGIVAIPALLLTGIFSHISANKKIKEIEEKMLEVYEVIDKIESNLLNLELSQKRTDELIQSLVKAKELFENEFKKVYQEIYKFPFLSKILKTIRKKIFRRNYFSEDDLKHIAYIGGLGSNFADLIDTPVFE